MRPPRLSGWRSGAQRATATREPPHGYRDQRCCQHALADQQPPRRCQRAGDRVLQADVTGNRPLRSLSGRLRASAGSKWVPSSSNAIDAHRSICRRLHGVLALLSERADAMSDRRHQNPPGCWASRGRSGWRRQSSAAAVNQAGGEGAFAAISPPAPLSTASSWRNDGAWASTIRYRQIAGPGQRTPGSERGIGRRAGDRGRHPHHSVPSGWRQARARPARPCTAFVEPRRKDAPGCCRCPMRTCWHAGAISAPGQITPDKLVAPRRRRRHPPTTYPPWFCPARLAGSAPTTSAGGIPHGCPGRAALDRILRRDRP